MQDNSVALADSAAEHYASVMDGLIADCSRLEDRVAELENRLQARNDLLHDWSYFTIQSPGYDHGSPALPTPRDTFAQN